MTTILDLLWCTLGVAVGNTYALQTPPFPRALWHGRRRRLAGSGALSEWVHRVLAVRGTLGRFWASEAAT